MIRDCYISCMCDNVRPAPVNPNGDRLQDEAGAIRRAKSHNARASKAGRHCNARVYRTETGALVWTRIDSRK